MDFSCKYLWILLQMLILLCFLSNNSLVEATNKYYMSYYSPCSTNVKQVYRTGFHLQPRKHWINDPNGPMYYKGIYHLFYQYNPKSVDDANIEWAHSVSKDMVNWKQLNSAIYPSKPFDKFGCWSGSATIRPGGKPIILYTGVVDPLPYPGIQVQNYAVPANYSDPYLQKWVKPDNNPIVTATKGENSTAFRDPTTAWLINGHWNILVGGGENNQGIAYLYKSKNFMRWAKAKHPLYSRASTGTWECPDFYPVSLMGTNGLDTSVVGENVKHVLKVSLDATRYDYYTIGQYMPEKDQYVPDDGSIYGRSGLRYDYGNFYASKTFFDASKKRRILWSWSNESDSHKEDVVKGWAGIQTIPRSIWLDPNGKQLLQWPIQELETLRGQNVKFGNKTLHKGDRIEVKGITAAQADVDVTFSFASLDKAEPSDPNWVGFDGQDVCSKKGSNVVGGVGPFGFLTLASKNLEEYTAIFFRVFKKKDGKFKVLLCSDSTRSSLDKRVYKPSFASFIDVDLAHKRLSLRSLIDHSVIESFGVGGKICITSRVYPTLAVGNNAHLYAFNNGSETVTIERLEAWTMNNSQMN